MHHHDILAVAYIRGHALKTGVPALPDNCRQKPLEQLTQEETSAILSLGRAAELKLYPFKPKQDYLPRIRKVLGFLRGIPFETLLDVGSGRGAFLFPLLAELPWVEVTAMDILPHRIDFLQNLAEGGMNRLHVLDADICTQPLPTHSADVVTLLEVLEHIPAVEKAVQAAVEMARKFVVVTVPSRPDDNPEHIHLLTRERLTELFGQAGCTNLHFDQVPEHLILIANVQ